MNLTLESKGDKEVTGWSRYIYFVLNDKEYDGTLFYSDEDGFDFDVNDCAELLDTLQKEGKDESELALILLDMAVSE